MKLFGRTGRKFTLMACSLILALTLVACGSANNTNTASGTPTGPSNGKNCKKSWRSAA